MYSLSLRRSSRDGTVEDTKEIRCCRVLMLAVVGQEMDWNVRWRADAIRC